MATKRQIAANRKNAKRSTRPRTDAGKARSAVNSTKHGLLSQFHRIEGADPQEFSKFAEAARANLKPAGEVEEYYFTQWIENAYRLDRLDNVGSALLAKEESLEDLSSEDMMNLLEFLEPLSARAFYQISEIEKRLNQLEARKKSNTQARNQNNRDADSISVTHSARDVAELSRGVELESLQILLLEHLICRLSKMGAAASNIWSTQTPTRTDRPEGDSDAPSVAEAIITMARAFSRNQAALALLLRYRVTIERSRDDALHDLQRLQAARRGLVVAAAEVVDVSNGKYKLRNEPNSCRQEIVAWTHSTTLKSTPPRTGDK